MEYLKSVIPVIESNYVNFTTVERSIADFFIYNREQMDFSAKSVAGKLFVSEASLSRFAKKCGFRGYREFIYQYEENFVVRQDSMTGNTRTVQAWPPGRWSCVSCVSAWTSRPWNTAT